MYQQMPTAVTAQPCFVLLENIYLFTKYIHTRSTTHERIVPCCGGFDTNSFSFKGSLASAPDCSHGQGAKGPPQSLCWWPTGHTCPLGWAAAVVGVHPIHTNAPVQALVVRAVVHVVSTDSSLETWTKQKQQQAEMGSQPLLKRVHPSHSFCSFSFS